MSELESIDYLRTHDITADEVRACAAFSHLTDREAEEVISTLKIFATIVVESYQKGLKKT